MMFRLLLILLAMALSVSSSEAAKQPNFVIIFIDDMGWRDWSGNGSDYLATPNIDKIGEEGLVFDQGYVNAANCAPSRCAILSGQYPPRNDFYNVFTIHRGNKKTDRLSLGDVPDGQTLKEEKLTFAEALKKVGYKTAMYGKWHVSGPENVMPDQQGFDDVIETHAHNLKNDPSEANNLALSNKIKRDEMLEELLAWHESVNAPVPKEPNPDLGKDKPRNKEAKRS
jgi:arylsulfatase A-like enzyme